MGGAHPYTAHLQTVKEALPSCSETWKVTSREEQEEHKDQEPDLVPEERMNKALKQISSSFWPVLKILVRMPRNLRLVSETISSFRPFFKFFLKRVEMMKLPWGKPESMGHNKFSPWCGHREGFQSEKRMFGAAIPGQTITFPREPPPQTEGEAEQAG